MSTGAPMLSVFVPGRPISINVAYGAGTHRRNRRFLTTDALTWRDSVSYDTQVKLGTMCRPHGEVEVHCTLYGVRGDADNYAKLLLDGLKYALHLDDRYFNPVVMAKARRTADKPQGALIEVWERREGQ